jgi:hypothetical protein
MKKILLPVIAVLLFFFNAAHAQTDNNFLAAADTKGGDVGAALPAPAGNDFASTHKAVVKTLSMYKDVSSTTSYTLKDKSILVRFSSNGKLFMAFFTNSGVWLHTVCSYEEPYLPSAVRNLVKRGYPGLKITYVDEVQTPGLEPVYRVQMQDEKKIVIVKVSGDEMEVDQEFEKRA